MKIIDFEPLTILTKKLHLRCLVLKTALNIGKMYMPLGGVKNLTYPLISRENRGQYASKNEHSISKLCEVTSKSLEMKHMIKHIFVVSPWILPIITIITQRNKHWKSVILSGHFKVFDIPVSKYCRYYALQQFFLVFLVSL